MTSLISKNKIMKQIEMKKQELKKLKELYETPSEYKILRMISDKYNLPLDIEEKINEYLQRIKMNINIKIFNDECFYVELLRSQWLKDTGAFLSNPLFIALRGQHSYRDPHRNNNLNLYGLKFNRHCHMFIREYLTKQDIINALEENKIKYLKNDTKHALMCKLLGKNHKDPIYTREMKRFVANIF